MADYGCNEMMISIITIIDRNIDMLQWKLSFGQNYF